MEPTDRHGIHVKQANRPLLRLRTLHPLKTLPTVLPAACLPRGQAEVPK